MLQAIQHRYILVAPLGVFVHIDDTIGGPLRAGSPFVLPSPQYYISKIFQGDGKRPWITFDKEYGL